jgi:3-hydroxybutyryl-CoA dehydrogenase
VGLDTTHQIAEIMFDEYRDARYAPPPAAQAHGARSACTGGSAGRGFYDYTQDPPRVSDLGL